MMCGLTADNNLWMGLRFIKQCLLLIYNNNTHSTAFYYINETTLFCEGVGGDIFYVAFTKYSTCSDLADFGFQR